MESILLLSKNRGHLVETEDRVKSVIPMFPMDPVPEQFPVKVISQSEEGGVPRVLIGQPGPLNMSYCSCSVSVTCPVDPKIIGQVSPVLEGKEFTLTENIAVGIVLMVGRIGPGANHDLEDGIIAVHPQEVVHCRLSVRPRLHP